MENLNGQYDIVITGGRVMDPETTLDAQRNVGVNDAGIEMPYPPT